MNILYLFSEGQIVQVLQMSTAEVALWVEIISEMNSMETPDYFNYN